MGFKKEHIVGFLGLGIFALIVGATILGAGPRTRGDWVVRFPEVKGLRKGDDVWMRGVPIGKVAHIELKPPALLASLKLYIPLTVFKDYKVELRPLTLFGGNYVSMDPGKPGGERVAPTTILEGALKYFPTKKASALFNSLGEELPAVRNGFGAIREAFTTGDGTAGRLWRDGTGGRMQALRETWNAAGALLGRLRDKAADETGNITRLRKLLGGAGFQELRKQVADIRDAYNDGRGSLPRFLDESFRADAQAAWDAFATLRASADRIADLWDASRGDLWHFLNDDELYGHVDKLKASFHALQEHFAGKRGSAMRLAYDEELHAQFKEAGETLPEWWSWKGVFLLRTSLLGSIANSAGLGEGRPGVIRRKAFGQTK